jgi:hypothetical protein
MILTSWVPSDLLAKFAATDCDHGLTDSAEISEIDVQNTIIFSRQVGMDTLQSDSCVS